MVLNQEEKNIADLLPNDPFGMEFGKGFPDDPVGVDFAIILPVDPFVMDFNIEATVAASSGLMGDLKSCRFGTDEASKDKQVDVDDNNDVITEVNFVWTSSMKYEKDEDENEVVDDGLVMSSEDGSFEDHNTSGDDMAELICWTSIRKYEQDESENEVADDGLVMSSEDGSFEDHNTSGDDLAELSSENYCVKDNEKTDVKDFNDSVEGAPADGLFFALGYLGVKDLLSVESVCKGLCDAVQNDTLLWRNIHIDYPLSVKITDDDLIRLTNRARGTLRSLSLEKCLKITNNGLKHVLESNLGLSKLSIPGCTKVSVKDILDDLKAFNSIGQPGIKHLRIGDLSGLKNEHFEEFKLLLGADEDKKTNNLKPRFYRAGEMYLSLEDERAIDIETCPRCQKARLVYECPSDSCQKKIHSTKACRGCILCIDRCENCGCCLDDRPYEETFCFDSLCVDCWPQAQTQTSVTCHIFFCG